MNVDFNKIDDLNAQIKVSVEKNDYLEKFNTELKNYQKKSSMKGFRKGKTPKSMIEKMYGKSLLADIVNQQLQEGLSNYLKDHDIEFLGQPIPSEDQALIQFDTKALKDYEFSFDLGLAPEFEVQGLDAEFTYYDATISEEDVETEWSRYRKQHGDRIDVESDFEDNDYLTFNALELEDGAVKKDGLIASVSVLVSLIDDEEVKNKVLAAKKGDKITFNVFTLEKDRTEEYVRKYILKLDEEEMDRPINPEFEGEIVEVKRVEPAEVNEEFLQKIFGEDAKTEEEGKSIIEGDIKKYYDAQSDSILFRDIQNKLMEANDIPLPDSFLERWLTLNNEKVSAEDIKKEYEAYFSKNLKWTLIRNKLVKARSIEVLPEDIQNELRNRVIQYAGGYNLGEDFINQTVQRLMQDQKQVEEAYEESLSAKLFNALKEEVTLSKEAIAQEALMEKIQTLRAEAQGGPVADEEE